MHGNMEKTIQRVHRFRVPYIFHATVLSFVYLFIESWSLGLGLGLEGWRLGLGLGLEGWSLGLGLEC